MSHIHTWDRGCGIFKKYSTKKESDFKNQFKQIGSYNHSLLEWNIFQIFSQPLSQVWMWLIEQILASKGGTGVAKRVGLKFGAISYHSRLPAALGPFF